MSQKQVRPVGKGEESAEPKKQEKKPATPQKGGETATTTAPKGSKTKKDLDKLLDEVEDILEENVEEFVRSYVQRGGQ